MRARAQRHLRTSLFASSAGALVLLTACIEPPRDADGQRESAPGSAGQKRKPTIPADGWNDDIAWRGLEEGLAEARRSGMPMMMVVHTAWCGNCKKLKRSFADESLARLSEQFVMVHIDQDEHPEARIYGPDGDYIPRVMFFDPDGNVDRRLQNPNRPDKFRYFYTPQEDLVASMREALDRHGNKS